MQYSDALIVDYGPEFLGHVFRVDDGIVCVVPRQVLDRGTASAMREMVGAAGGTCGACGSCPLGQTA